MTQTLTNSTSQSAHIVWQQSAVNREQREAGHLTWLTDKPSVEGARVIVTLLPVEEAPALNVKRRPSPRIAGQGKILGDIIAPAAPIEDWKDLL